MNGIQRMSTNVSTSAFNSTFPDTLSPPRRRFSQRGSVSDMDFCDGKFFPGILMDQIAGYFAGYILYNGILPLSVSLSAFQFSSAWKFVLLERRVRRVQICMHEKITRTCEVPITLLSIFLAGSNSTCLRWAGPVFVMKESNFFPRNACMENFDGNKTISWPISRAGGFVPTRELCWSKHIHGARTRKHFNLFFFRFVWLWRREWKKYP